jgi:hypothetical protein
MFKTRVAVCTCSVVHNKMVSDKKLVDICP